MKLYRYCLIIALLSPMSSAQEISLTQSLDFGLIVVASNNNAGSYSINRRGRYTHTREFGVISPGQNGVYTVTGLRPFALTTFNFVALASEMNTNNGGFTETFGITIDDFDATRAADSTGRIDVPFGGTLTTSGSGVVQYESTPYTALLQFTINN